MKQPCAIRRIVAATPQDRRVNQREMPFDPNELGTKNFGIDFAGASAVKRGQQESSKGRMTTVRTLQPGRLFKVSAAILILLGLSAGPAAAVTATTIDFAGAGNGTGTVSWAGGSSPLVGTGIVITTVSASAGLPNSATPHGVTSGVLSFTTGAFTGLGDGYYNFAPGGGLTITGAVPDANISTTILLDAVNVAAKFQPNVAGLQFSMTIPFGSDTKNADLLNYFGLSPSTPFTFTGTLTGPGVSVGLGGFTASITSADILNTVPAPSSLLLLGSALVGVGLIVSRKLMGQRT